MNDHPRHRIRYTSVLQLVFRKNRFSEMKKLLIYAMAAVVAVSLGVAFWAADGLSDFDLSEHSVRDVSFQLGDTVLSGTLVMPRDVSSPPIAVIVHGDGAQDRFSNGGYFPLVNTLVDAGIGIFSWDKAGVGASTGNWLDQTMDDRADEALAALQAISKLDDVNLDQIGFLGFSQAGWVLPRVANRSTPAFTVIVGGAVSWRDQGTYYSRVRMVSEGVAQDVIEQHLADRNLRNDALFDASPLPSASTDMDPARFRFVADAYWEDSTDLISGMKGPVLAVWGEDDLNVDARSDSEIFQDQLMPLTEDRNVVMVPNATHGLLRADLFNYQLPSDWPWYLQYVFLGMGRDAFSEQSLGNIAGWILSVRKD
jgi:alpha-beta hydrolase superfamily lysophospholipase